MYETAKKSRAANKAKAERLANRPLERVDSSDWTPPPLLNADVKTGMRPVSKQALKRGGKVHGSAPKARADRMARKAGGRVGTEGEQPIVDRYINRDLKKANEYRDGKKHDGALKRGGRAKKADGGRLYKPYDRSPIAKYNELREREIQSEAEKKLKRLSEISPVGRPSMTKGENESYTSSGLKRGGRAKLQQGGKPPVNWAQAEEDYRPTKRDPNYKQPDLSEGSEQITKMIDAQRSRQEAQRKDGGRAGHKLAKGTKNARAKHKDGGKIHSDVKEDKALIKKMVKPSAMKDKACYGGRMKKADGGGMDPRLGLVKPKVMEFGQNVVTPGLKKGGRIAKQVGGPAIMAGKEAIPAMAPVAVQAAPARDLPPVGSGLAPQSNVLSNPGPVYDPEKYDKADNSKLKGLRNINNPKFYKEWTGLLGAGDYFGIDGYPKIGAKNGGRIARAKGGRTKGKGKTNINIVIAGNPKQGADQAGMPQLPPTGPGGPAGIPVPVPPAGMGAPMGAAGAMPPQMPPMPPAAAGAPPMGGAAMGARPRPFKQGGRITKVAKSFKDMEAGAGSGEGRLQKTDIAKRAPHKAGGKVYRSYKDMDAGAGSGFGRLEKTEIEARKSRKG